MPLKRSASRKKPTQQDESHLWVLGPWRFWLLSALIGAVLAWLLFQVASPHFRAQATVVVDNNLEEAWVYFPDRQLFQFLARETDRLVELAWSDGVMQVVSAQVVGIPVQDLRGAILQLSQPADGGWHFYATYPDAKIAQQLAAAWATAFVEATRAAVEVSPQLQATRAALVAELLQTEPDEALLRALMEEIGALSEQTKGISLFVELSLSQAANLPVERSVSAATYLFVGSLAGALVASLWLLLVPATWRRLVLGKG
jgi:hypothetical protein